MLSYHRRHRRPSSHWELTILFSIIKTIAPNISECRNGKFLQRQDGVLGKEKKKKTLKLFSISLIGMAQKSGSGLAPWMRGRTGQKQPDGAEERAHGTSLRAPHLTVFSDSD